MSKVLSSHPTFGHVNQSNIVDGFPAIVINHPNCQARVSLYGGHVLSWQPKDQQDVFWLSNSTAYQEGSAIRGGIPLCWPWFGPLEGSNQHGFARQVFWQCDEVKVNEQGVTLLLSWQGENMDKLWPHSVKLEQRLFFGVNFEQSLTIINRSANNFDYTGALHSYFKVSSPENVTVPTLDDAAFYDKLTDQRVAPFSRENCVGPIDTVYDCDKPQQLIDTGWQRIIEITNQNTQQWVLWNPGVETAQQMADIHEHGEQEYVCLEAANTQWQTVAANSSKTISQKIVIKGL
jgi:glucose-6-phosphate 1-epimerase